MHAQKVDMEAQHILDLDGAFPKRTADGSGGQNGSTDGSGVAAPPSDANRKVWMGRFDVVDEARVKAVLPVYKQQALLALQFLYPSMPVPECRQLLLTKSKGLFGPAFVQLSEEFEMYYEAGPQGKLPYTPLKKPRSYGFKMPDPNADRLNALIHFLETYYGEGPRVDAELRKECEFLGNNYMYIDEIHNPFADGTMECLCCFIDRPFQMMTQCTDGHLFCKSCVRRCVEEAIGSRKPQLKCVAATNERACLGTFPMSEIRKIVDEKTMSAYERLVQEMEIEKALRIHDADDGDARGGSQFVSCPFCPFGAEMETTPEEDKLFRCQNPDCMKLSCRLCQKESHIPLTCKEADRDGVIALQHRVEEAMTEALLRQCPKCQRRFLKEDGCNKMICSCGTMICYICRKVIKGYDHFNSNTNRTDTHMQQTGNCPLWDDSKAKDAALVVQAAEEIAQELKNEVDDAFVLKQLEEERKRLAAEVQKGIKVVKPPVLARPVIHNQARRNPGPALFGNQQRPVEAQRLVPHQPARPQQPNQAIDRSLHNPRNRNHNQPAQGLQPIAPPPPAPAPARAPRPRPDPVIVDLTGVGPAPVRQPNPPAVIDLTTPPRRSKRKVETIDIDD